MPIGGFVISVDPREIEKTVADIKTHPQVEVHGVDEKGNVVAVLDTESSEEMERLTGTLQKIVGVLSVGITYFDAEDEVEKIQQGLITPTFSFGRKGEKPKGDS